MFSHNIFKWEHLRFWNTFGLIQMLFYHEISRELSSDVIFSATFPSNHCDTEKNQVANTPNSRKRKENEKENKSLKLVEVYYKTRAKQI